MMGHTFRYWFIVMILSFRMGYPADAAEQDMGDREALIQIDKDMDVANKLNWHQMPGDRNPGDGGWWKFVTWSPDPEARVVSIFADNILLSGSSDAFGRLKKMQRLDLADNQISDISSFSHLKELRDIQLSGNAITDISYLQNLTNIEFLALARNQISYVPSLSKLSKVVVLHLYDNHIMQIDDMTGMDSLKELDLDDNYITDVTFLINLNKLESLKLGNNSISDVTPLNLLTSVTYLELRNNNIEDIKPLGGLPKLEILILGNNKISDVFSLLSLPKSCAILINENQLPYSQIYPLINALTLYTGIQRDVKIPGIDQPLHVDKKYDIRSEHIFDGITTEYAVASKNGEIVEPGETYVIDDGILRFLKPGKYYLYMRNEAFHRLIRGHYSQYPNLVPTPFGYHYVNATPIIISELLHVVPDEDR